MVLTNRLRMRWNVCRKIPDVPTEPLVYLRIILIRHRTRFPSGYYVYKNSHSIFREAVSNSIWKNVIKFILISNKCLKNANITRKFRIYTIIYKGQGNNQKTSCYPLENTPLHKRMTYPKSDSSDLRMLSHLATVDHTLFLFPLIERFTTIDSQDQNHSNIFLFIISIYLQISRVKIVFLLNPRIFWDESM